MDLTLIKLSLETLLNRVEKLEAENEQLKKLVSGFGSKPVLSVAVNESIPEQDDKLIDTDEVLQILGISYNTLRDIVKKTLIVPVRINQRRVRYSYRAIIAYIKSRSY